MRIAIYQENPVESRRLGKILRAAGHHVVILEGRIGLISLLSRSTMDLVVTERQLVTVHGCNALPMMAGCCYRMTPQVISSSNHAPAQIAAGIDSGALDYVLQPIEDDAFCLRISVALRRAYPSLQNVAPFKVGRYLVDPGRKIISIREVPLIGLSETVFRLAYCFLANMGRPLSRDYLRAFIGVTTDGNPAKFLDSQIAALKAALQIDDDDGHALRAIHDFGYVLEAIEPAPKAIHPLLAAMAKIA